MSTTGIILALLALSVTANIITFTESNKDKKLELRKSVRLLNQRQVIVEVPMDTPNVRYWLVEEGKELQWGYLAADESSKE